MTHINPRSGFGYQSVSQGWQGGNTCLCIVFIIKTLKKPKGSFGKMGQETKKTLLWDSSILILGQKKVKFHSK
jgi:hypothetical protein